MGRVIGVVLLLALYGFLHMFSGVMGVLTHG